MTPATSLVSVVIYGAPVMNPAFYVGITVFVLFYFGFESPEGTYILLWPHHLAAYFHVELLYVVDVIFYAGEVLLTGFYG